MKIYVLSLLMFGWTGGLFAQGPTSSLPSLPEGPLLKRAPDFATWTVLSRKGGSGPEPQDITPGQEKARPQRQVVVTKTGQVIHEVTVDAGGKSTEVWHVGGVQVTVPPRGISPSVFPDYGGGDIYTTNYATSDFAGLEWVSAATYAGIQKVMGRDCIIFRSTVNVLQRDEQIEIELQASRDAAQKLAELRKNGKTANPPPGPSAPNGDAGKAPAVACIDLETRLPLVVTFGKETRTYQYGQPPSEVQILPASLATAVNEFQTRIQGLARLPAKP